MSSLILTDNSNNDDDVVDDRVGGPVGPLPTVSSRINFQVQKKVPIYDLWIVGCGTLGSLVAQEWKREFPDAVVVAETKTTSRHDFLASCGVSTRLREARNSTLEARLARNVLICLPPSGALDYETELCDACALWSGEETGNMVFTSSTVVYGDKSNVVNEAFRLDSRSARATKMISAEESVLSRGACVIRLAGLYTELRGPHTFWLRNGTVDGNADGVVNMLHYEDAATAAVAALKSGYRREVFLACDDVPETRLELCTAALQSGLFPTLPLPTFKQAFGPRGKTCDSTITRQKLQWTPKYRSFGSFMRKLGGIADPDPVPESVVDSKPTGGSGLWLPGDDLDSL